MIKKLKYTVHILLLVFVLPMVSQSWHMLQHQKAQHAAHTCQHETHAGDNITPRHSESAECPICEYEFYVNYIPNKQIDLKPLSFACFSATRLQSFLVPAQMDGLRTPRAPPSNKTYFC